MSLAHCSIRFESREQHFHFRRDSVGDKGVLQQVFQNQEYAVAQWLQGQRLGALHQTILRSGRRPLIVDAGANIGASAVWFLNVFPDSFVYAIEPDRSNVELLALNTQAFPHKHLYTGAIASYDGEVRLFDPGLSDWGFRITAEALPAEMVRAVVPCISPNTILQSDSVRDTIPFIMKIDIEGAEGDLFRCDVEWMDRFPLLIIELHDWMLPFQHTSRAFIQALARYDFEVLVRGENLFLFNMKLLVP